MLLNLVDRLPGRGQRAAELEQELLQRLVVDRRRRRLVPVAT
jgi:hypothetical protein